MYRELSFSFGSMFCEQSDCNIYILKIQLSLCISLYICQIKVNYIQVGIFAFLYAYGFIEATTFAENTSFNEDMRQRPQPIFSFFGCNNSSMRPNNYILRKATGCRKNNNIYQIYIPRPSVSPIMQQDVCPIRCYPLPLLA